MKQKCNVVKTVLDCPLNYVKRFPFNFCSSSYGKQVSWIENRILDTLYWVNFSTLLKVPQQRSK